MVKVKSSTKLKCTACGKEKAATVGFYVSHSRLYICNEGRMPICKDCFFLRYKELLDKYDKDELRAIYYICMQFDIYFDSRLIEESQENVKNDEFGLLKVYMKNVNSLTQYRGRDSIDGEHISLEDNKEIIDFKENDDEDVLYEEINYEDMKIKKEVKKRWGNGYSNEDYVYLEDTYQEFYDCYPHDTPAERLLLRQLSTTLLEGEICRRKGDRNGYEKMSKLVSSMLTDSNIKPSQKKSMGDEVGECFGVFIEHIEKSDPIPDAICEFEDVDKIGELIDRQFVKNFAKIFGLAGDDNENEN